MPEGASRLAELIIIIWDVGLGNSVFLKTPNGKTAMLDCGAKAGIGFSPAEHMKNRWNIDKLDYLVISHPHVDHIQDIEKVDTLMSPRVLSRNSVVTEQKIYEENKEVFETHKNLIQKYLEMDKRYSAPVSGAKSPSSDLWGAGVTIKNFCNKNLKMNLNDLSMVNFIKFGDITVVYPGDIENRGWEELLESSSFVECLIGTRILVASHHGRESGFSSSIFEHFTPELTIVSDGRFGDTSATPRYSSVTNGMEVTRRANESKITRKVITTRKDGPIFIKILDGQEINVRID